MDKKKQEQLDQLRHSAAHLLAAAVLELYPGTKNTIGPAIENGFYYDFDFSQSSKQGLTEEDLAKIEAKMKDLLPAWTSFERIEVSADQAKQDFAQNPYKLELIEEFSQDGQNLTEYKSGNFIDLCRGGHTENPAQDIKAFKLLSIAGAYWRGNEKNQMLTRIYGTAFPTQLELEKHLEMLEEAKKRDHRKLGQELELFTFSDEIGPGLPLWMPKGTIIKEELEKLGKEVELEQGYMRVSTPHIAKDALYYLSGHLPYYAEDMYPPMESKDGKYYLKPMNCPHMHMIFKAKLHSYREFPIRYAEFGTVYRYEDSGTLFGLLRVRGMTQNDAHIYCASKEQAVEELVKVMKLHADYYEMFGIKDYYIELALPDFAKKKDKYFDDPKAWEESIAILKEAAQASGVEVIEDHGGAAFYGPKFDFNIKSAIGRTFGASTNQLDFGSGERFKLNLVDHDGNQKTVPYIIHRAPLGSDERFIGFLIEHFGGAFPTWLSPTQVMIVPISDANNEYGQKLLEELRKSGIRAEIDDRSERMQAKIRDAQLQKIPYMLVVGNREQEQNQVAVRTRFGEDLGAMPKDKFIDKIIQEINLRSYQD